MKFRCIFCVIHLQSLQKCFGRIFSIFACKNEALCSEVQTHLEVFTLKVQKKSSGRIFKIFASKNEGISRHVQTHFGSSLPASFTEKVLGAIPRFVRPKTKLFAVKFRRILEVLCLTRFMKKVDASSRFFRPKVKLFAVEFRRSLEVFSVQALYTKFWVHFPIFGSKNEAVC